MRTWEWIFTAVIGGPLVVLFALAALRSTPEDMRYEHEPIHHQCSKNSATQMTEKQKYRGYVIYYDPPPIPIRRWDWHFVHEDYDGAPEHSFGNPTDDRCGDGQSLQDCRNQIDAMIDMAEDD